MLLFIPRSLCALKRIAAKTEHCRFGATQGIRIALSPGLYRAEATDGRRAMIVQGEMPAEDPPWPGFKEVPDDHGALCIAGLARTAVTDISAHLVYKHSLTNDRSSTGAGSYADFRKVRTARKAPKRRRA